MYHTLSTHSKIKIHIVTKTNLIIGNYCCNKSETNF